MKSVTASAKIMQNYTICIAQPIREQLKWKQGDQLILSLDENGEVKIMKAITSLDELVGIGEETFKALGGGEKFLANERKNWE